MQICNSLAEHTSGVGLTRFVNVFGRFVPLNRVCCVLRTSLCAFERSSRSFSSNPEHGLRPLIHEITCLTTPATRHGQGAGSQTRASLLDTLLTVVQLIVASLVLVTRAVLAHRCPLTARTITPALAAPPFAKQQALASRGTHVLASLRAHVGRAPWLYNPWGGIGGACDDKKGLPGLEGPPEA